LLQSIAADDVATYQPYWALLAHLLTACERHADAADAYTRAIGLCDDPATREFLMRKETASHA
jgi:RNA polymerase sigma-70 factor (ECF subfamily)